MTARTPANKAGPKGPALLSTRTAEGELRTEQSGYMRTLADRIERGELLSQMERDVAAAVLRRQAVRTLANTSPKKPGHQPQINRYSVAMEFAMAVEAGSAVSKAIASLAERHGVSDTTIKNAIKECGAQVFNELLTMVKRDPSDRSKTIPVTIPARWMKRIGKLPER